MRSLLSLIGFRIGLLGASEQTLPSQTVASGIGFAPGDVLTVVGYENAGEHARLDYLDFTPSF